MRIHKSAPNMSKSLYFNGHYIIKDTLGTTQRTADFLTYERVRLSGSASVIANVGDRLVGAGCGGYLATNDDGVTWTER